MRRVVYVIMNTDRTLIVKGNKGERALVKIKNRKDKKPIATYSSRRKAENAMLEEYVNETNIRCTFDDLEVVECYLSLYER